MKKEMIMKEFEKRGYLVEDYVKLSNGVEMEGFVIKIGSVSPIIYTKSYLEEAEYYQLNVHQVVDKIIENLKDYTQDFDFNFKSLMDSDFVLSHALIAVQKTSKENILKRNSFFEGIEEYIYISLSDSYSYKLLQSHLEIFNFSEDELWKIAENNSRNEITIENMAAMMNEISDNICDFDEDLFPPIYVVSNKSRSHGAYGALDREFIKKFANNIGVNGFAVLPSSIHEMLLYPFRDISEINIDELNQMVHDVNHVCVSPEERLTDRAYLYTF